MERRTGGVVRHNRTKPRILYIEIRKRDEEIELSTTQTTYTQQNENNATMFFISFEDWSLSYME
jgi:hypothetical protein